MSNRQDAVDYVAVTKAQQQTWASGDFSVLAIAIMPVAEHLVERVDPSPKHRVLDVACGTGNTALVASRRFCDVVGIDFVPALLERARQRSAAEGTPVEFKHGDAQALPFDDATFDVVLSTFGVMFAPNQQLAASELVRVCRPGGTIGLASWTPEGNAGSFFQAVAKYASPAPGPNMSSSWGSENDVRELLGDRVRMTTERRTVVEHFRSREHALEIFCQTFPPIRRMLDALEPSAQRAMKNDLAAWIDATNTAKDGSVALPLEYLEVIAKRV